MLVDKDAHQRVTITKWLIWPVQTNCPIRQHFLIRGWGALNFGLRAMCHQKDPTFFAHFHRKTPIFTNCHPMTPYFWQTPCHRKTLTHDLCHSKTLIFALNSQTSDNFPQKNLDFWKISTNLTKCWEIFGHFGPENPYFLMHFTERPPYFGALCHWERCCQKKVSAIQIWTIQGNLEETQF